MAGSCAGFPGAACMQLAGARVDKKNPVLQMLESVFWLSTGASDLRSAKRQTAIVVAPPTKVNTREFKELVPILFLSFFIFFPFGSQILKIKKCEKQLHNRGIWKVTKHTQEKVQAQKKTLRLHI